MFGNNYIFDFFYVDSSPIRVKASGTVTADGSEQTLLDTDDAGIYCFAIDINNMAEGDDLTIKMSMKILSGGSEEIILENFSEDESGISILYTAPKFASQGAVFTIEQTAGTNRNYPWKVVEFGAVTGFPYSQIAWIGM